MQFCFNTSLRCYILQVEFFPSIVRRGLSINHDHSLQNLHDRVRKVLGSSFFTVFLPFFHVNYFRHTEKHFYTQFSLRFSHFAIAGFLMIAFLSHYFSHSIHHQLSSTIEAAVVDMFNLKFQKQT